MGVNKKETIVVALGGNALNSPEDRGGYLEQVKNAKISAKKIIEATKKGYKLIITHGNGPQVGNILLQQELSKEHVSPMPLSICGAQSQGQIGTILVGAINNEIKKLNLKTQAVVVVSHVLVDKKDPAFKKPTKPVGPMYTPTEAKKLKKKGFVLKQIKVGAWRRVVPSPLPLRILEQRAIKCLLEQNLIPVVVGGGGIPVINTPDRKLKLVDAVIDKDLASQVLATQLKADKFIILTNVKKVALNFQKPNQKNLDKLTIKEAKDYLDAGHFPPGTMGPKIEAAIKFIESGGKKAVIANLKDLLAALEGKAGTIITK